MAIDQRDINDSKTIYVIPGISSLSSKLHAKCNLNLIIGKYGFYRNREITATSRNALATVGNTVSFENDQIHDFWSSLLLSCRAEFKLSDKHTHKHTQPSLSHSQPFCMNVAVVVASVFLQVPVSSTASRPTFSKITLFLVFGSHLPFTD